MIKPSGHMFRIGRELLKSEFQEVHEEFNAMDIFGFTPHGDSCEIEVKVADYDFHKEFKKESKVKKHAGYMFAYATGKGFVPTRFYFFVLSNLTKRALAKIEAKQLPYGLIEYNSSSGEYRIVKKSEKLTSKPFLGELGLSVPKKDFKHKRTTD